MWSNMKPRGIWCSEELWSVEINEANNEYKNKSDR